MSAKPGPIKRCTFEGCETFTAWRYCARHRRIIAGRSTTSTAELARRVAEEREQGDPLHVIDEDGA